MPDERDDRLRGLLLAMREFGVSKLSTPDSYEIVMDPARAVFAPQTAPVSARECGCPHPLDEHNEAGECLRGCPVPVCAGEAKP